METSKTEKGNIYRIRVKEILDPTTTDWFGALSLTSLEDNGTLLTGLFPDQSALRGFLDQLWNLNFTIVSVERAGDGISPGFSETPTIEGKSIVKGRRKIWPLK